MKQELVSLYKSKHSDFKKVVETFPEDDLAGPFLMSPNSHYRDQKIPLLIIGQETKGWTYHIDDIDKQMATYENFNLGIDYWASPFWNITRKLERALGNKEYSCAWTNISKFDLDAGPSQGDHEKAISALDHILASEIEILSPKMCLFYTGPFFDQRIKKIFAGIEFTQIPGWSKRQFCQLKHPDLPELTFRSYHPNFLRRSKLEENFIDYFSKI